MTGNPLHLPVVLPRQSCRKDMLQRSLLCRLCVETGILSLSQYIANMEKRLWELTMRLGNGPWALGIDIQQQHCHAV